LSGVKADLGALILGVLVGGHPKASELAKSLLGFKELFLVGFFLNIGLSGAPTLEAIGAATLFTVLVPFKVALFFLLLTRFNLRARTSVLAAFSLANYSEFGLIVGAVGVTNGWIGAEWLVIVAISLSMTFILASPLSASAHRIYARFHDLLVRYETGKRHPDDPIPDPGNAEIAVFGMGRVGTGAYDAMRERYGDVVLGIDADSRSVQEHQKEGRNVILGDAADADLWEKIPPGKGKVRLVMLAMPDHSANLYAVKQLTQRGYEGLVEATAQYDDEIEALKEEGVDAAFSFYAEAGLGFADHVCRVMEGEKAG
jgi:TrkA family protein/sodium/hydrogen exchanger family protein